MISQHFLIEHFLPYLKQHGITHRKFNQVKARAAKAGEMVVSITADGIETKNTAEEGDYVVQNMTSKQEEYIVKPGAFHQKYQPANSNKDGWEVYNALGKVVALEMNAATQELFGWQSPFYIEAPWKEKMIVKQDDFLVTPLPDSKEIYRIARQEFFETYEPA